VAHADLAEVLTATGATAEALGDAEKALSILQRLSAADPSNAVYSRNVGLCYEKFGVAFARRGTDETRLSAERIKDWMEARAWFEKALRLFSDLRDWNQLMPTDSGQIAKFQEKIHECDDATARLKV
jgi:tetratricopeptide (TPR) repeat protein